MPYVAQFRGAPQGSGRVCPALWWGESYIKEKKGAKIARGKMSCCLNSSGEKKEGGSLHSVYTHREKRKEGKGENKKYEVK